MTSTTLSPQEAGRSTVADKPDFVSFFRLCDGSWQKMRIAIDALSAKGEGGWDYARAIIQYMSRLRPHWRFLVLVTRNQYEGFKINARNVEWRILNPIMKRNSIRMLWQQAALPVLLRKWRADVVYTLSSMDIFFSPCPTVIKIGNMLPFDDFALGREKSLHRKIWWLRWAGMISSRTADQIIVMSETARQELVSKFGFPASRSAGVVHSADVEELEGYDAAKDAVARLGEDFILTVSHVYRYKNLYELLCGYRLAMQEGAKLPSLVIAGGDMDKDYSRELKQYVSANNLTDRVLFLGNVPRHGLASLYRACRFLIFSSLVETCPRTLIEALKCGTAIMCSNRSVMPEIGGEAPLYFDPGNPQEIAAKLATLAADQDLITLLRRKSQKEGQRFDWKITAHLTLDVLQRTAEKTFIKEAKAIHEPTIDF